MEELRRQNAIMSAELFNRTDARVSLVTGIDTHCVTPRESSVATGSSAQQQAVARLLPRPSSRASSVASKATVASTLTAIEERPTVSPAPAGAAAAESPVRTLESDAPAEAFVPSTKSPTPQPQAAPTPRSPPEATPSPAASPSGKKAPHLRSLDTTKPVVAPPAVEPDTPRTTLAASVRADVNPDFPIVPLPGKRLERLRDVPAVSVSVKVSSPEVVTPQPTGSRTTSPSTPASPVSVSSKGSGGKRRRRRRGRSARRVRAAGARRVEKLLIVGQDATELVAVGPDAGPDGALHATLDRRSSDEDGDGLADDGVDTDGLASAQHDDDGFGRIAGLDDGDDFSGWGRGTPDIAGAPAPAVATSLARHLTGQQPATLDGGPMHIGVGTVAYSADGGGSGVRAEGLSHGGSSFFSIQSGGGVAP